MLVLGTLFVATWLRSVPARRGRYFHFAEGDADISPGLAGGATRRRTTPGIVVHWHSTPTGLWMFWGLMALWFDQPECMYR